MPTCLPSIHLLVRPSVRPSIRPFVCSRSSRDYEFGGMHTVALKIRYCQAGSCNHQPLHSLHLLASIKMRWHYAMRWQYARRIMGRGAVNLSVHARTSCVGHCYHTHDSPYAANLEEHIHKVMVHCSSSRNRVLCIHMFVFLNPLYLCPLNLLHIPSSVPHAQLIPFIRLLFLHLIIT